MRKKIKESGVRKIIRVERVFGVVVPSEELDLPGATASDFRLCCLNPCSVRTVSLCMCVGFIVLKADQTW